MYFDLRSNPLEKPSILNAIVAPRPIHSPAPSRRMRANSAVAPSASTIESIQGEAVAEYFIAYCKDNDISSIASGYIRNNPQRAITPC